MPTSAAPIIGIRAMAKRIVWAAAQGCILPSAAEYNTATPKEAVSRINSTSPQLMLGNPPGGVPPLCLEQHVAADWCRHGRAAAAARAAVLDHRRARISRGTD